MSDKYPLEQLALIKKRRLDEAEKILAEKKKALEQELSILKKVEDERNQAKTYKEEKLQQLRDAMDEGEKADKIDMMKEYLKVVNAELEKKEAKVKEQVSKVEAAEKAVEEARKDMIKKQHDVEKLKEHKKDWKKDQAKEEKRQEGIVSDEMGTSMFSRKKR